MLKQRRCFFPEDKRLRANVRAVGKYLTSSHGAAPSDLFHEASRGGSGRWEELLWESVFPECKCPLVFARPRERAVVEGFQHWTLLLLLERRSDLDNPPCSSPSPCSKPSRALGRQFLGFSCPLVDKDENLTYSPKRCSF